MLKLRILSFIFLLTACGGGTGEKQNIIVISPPIPENISIAVRDPPSNTITEPQNDYDWLAIVRWQGPENKTFKQINKNWYESAIDTGKTQFRPVIGGGPHNIVAYTRINNPQPIVTGLKFSWQQAIRDFWTDSLGVAQLSLVIYIKDKTNTNLALVINSYESRPSLQDYQPYIDSDTFTIFFSSPVQQNQFMSTNQRQVTGLTDRQNFEVVISAENFIKILEFAEQRGLTVSNKDLANWSMTHVGLLHETFMNNSSTIQLRSLKEFSTVKVEKLIN